MFLADTTEANPNVMYELALRHCFGSVVIIIAKEGIFMSDSFYVVKKYIDQMDYYDLLANGAPSDEFDIESKEICTRVRCEHSVCEIAEIMALVFNEYFDEHDDATVFLAIAEQIKNAVAFSDCILNINYLFLASSIAFLRS